MPRAFCSQCGAEVPVDENGRCYVGHSVDIGAADQSLQAIADKAARDADPADTDSWSPEPGTETADQRRFDLDGGADEAADAGPEAEGEGESGPPESAFDIAALEAAVAELGFSRDDLASVPADEREELALGNQERRLPDADAEDGTAGRPAALADDDAPADEAPDDDAPHDDAPDEDDADEDAEEHEDDGEPRGQERPSPRSTCRASPRAASRAGRRADASRSVAADAGAPGRVARGEGSGARPALQRRGGSASGDAVACAPHCRPSPRDLSRCPVSDDPTLDASDEALVSALAGPLPGEDADGAALMTLEELAEASDLPLAVLEAIEREGFLLPRSAAPRSAQERRYSSADARAVKAGMTLLEAGLPLGELLDLARRYDAAMQDVADHAVELFVRFVRDPVHAATDSEDEAATRLVSAFQQMLPATGDLVAHHFRRLLLARAQLRLARELERDRNAAGGSTPRDGAARDEG